MNIHAAGAVKSRLAKFGIDGFLIGIILVIMLAYVYPQPGIITQPVSLEAIAGYGVSVIFFFYGLKLNFKKLAGELMNWRMHITIQVITFLAFPLLGLIIKPFFEENSLLWLGIFYLSCLPSTVSSSVVMVSIARGNVPAAIFNASISTLLGVFITPLWMIAFIETEAVYAGTGTIIVKLIVQVIVPVAAGMLLHTYGAGFAERNKTRLKLFDQSVILLIIYTSFCHSFYSGAFGSLSITSLLFACAGMTVLFFVVYFFTAYICRLLNFKAADRITVLFCGSKKSLVHGTVMSKILFPATMPISIILLPVMLYHSLQLIFVGIIAQKTGSRHLHNNINTSL